MMTNIQWQQPLLFCLLPLPILIYFILPRAKSYTRSALYVPFFSVVESLQKKHERQAGARLRHWCLPLLIWSALIAAAAGPYWLGDAVMQPTLGRDIMLAVDVSGSMQIEDMQLEGHYTDRLTIVKFLAKDFIGHRTGDHLGLILFGTNAYLLTPMTYDRKTVVAMLDDASIGLAGEQTAIGDAIGLGIKRLRHRKGRSKVLVLLSDGANNSGHISPIQAADLASQVGIKVYTVGIGAEKMVMPTFTGKRVINPSADLDEKALKAIAEKTGGRYFRARDIQSLAGAYKTINALEPVSEESQSVRPMHPLYHWFLGVALMLSCLVFFRQIYPRRQEMLA